MPTRIAKIILIFSYLLWFGYDLAEAASSDDKKADTPKEKPAVFFPTGKTDSGGNGFIAKRRALLKQLQEGGNGRETAEVLLELAELSLDQGLVLEGLSYAKAISTGAFPVGQVAYPEQLAAAFSAIHPYGETVTDQTLETLRAADKLKYREVFLAVAYAKRGENDEATNAIGDAMSELEVMPDGLAMRVLPTLLSAATTVENQAVARSLTEQFLVRDPTHNNTPLRYLIGQIALQNNDTLRAFDNFVHAAGGTDVWAHRARLATVDLAVTSKAISPAEIQEMLSYVYSFWRGDDETLDTLRRMLETARENGNKLKALDVMATILREYPDSPAAEQVRGESDQTLKAYYTAGRKGALTFEQFVVGHRQIAAKYRFFMNYDRWSESFADHVREIGAIGMAAEEYRLTREYLEVSDMLHVLDADPKRIFELIAKEAGARLDVGQIDQAATLLRRAGEFEDAEIAARLGALRAKYSQITGTRLEVDAEQDAHSTTYIRLLAQEFFANEDWAGAKSQYLRLAKLLGPNLTDRDAVELILSSHRSGDTELSRVLGGIIIHRNEFENDALDADLELGQFIPLELRQVIADETLKRADSVIDQVIDLSRETRPPPDVVQE